MSAGLVSKGKVFVERFPKEEWWIQICILAHGGGSVEDACDVIKQNRRQRAAAITVVQARAAKHI